MQFQISTIFILSFLFYSINSFSQKTYQVLYGSNSSKYDMGYNVIENQKGNYIMCGYTEQFGAREAFISELGCDTGIAWMKVLDENFGKQSKGNSIKQLFDGSYLLVGSTETYSSGLADIFVSKHDQNGNVIWFKVIGTASNYELINNPSKNIIETLDSGIVIGAIERSTSGDMNALLFKLDKNGNLLWSKSIGNTGSTTQEQIYGIVEKNNGDIIATGSTNSFGASATSNLLLIKLDKNGNLLFARAYGGVSTNHTRATAIENTKNDGYIIGGDSWVNAMPHYFFMIKFDANDNLIWMASHFEAIGLNTFDGTITSIKHTNDNAFVVSGWNQNGIRGSYDAFLFKVDSIGTIKWAKAYGDQGIDYFQNIIQTKDSGFLAIGYSVNIGVSAGALPYNILVVKTDKDGNCGCNESPLNLIYRPPINFPFIAGASISNYGTSNSPSPIFTNEHLGLHIACSNNQLSNFNPLITGKNIICEGDSTTFKASFGNLFLWNTGNTTHSITVQPTTNSIYTLSVSYSRCYAPITKTVNVAVTSIPLLFITGDSVICSGQVASLSVQGTWTSYKWNAGQTTQQIFVSPLQKTTYTLQATNGICSNLDSIDINVNPLPNLGISGTNQICKGDSTTLQASGGLSYLWNTGVTSQLIHVNPQVSTTYTLVGSDGLCTDTITKNIFVNVPIIKVSNDTSISHGSSAALAANGGVSYYWTPSTGLSCVTCSSPIASPKVKTTYYVVSYDANGCMATDSVTITVEEQCHDIFIPNAFSPNSDGQNDFFRIYGNCIEKLDCSIYDRWGERVAHLSNSEIWDGNYNGKTLDTGVFSVIASIELKNNISITKSGTVYLIK